MDSGQPIDALLIVPPPSPSETNPPLGPMILARAADRNGVHVRICDLNIEYLRRFRGVTDDRGKGIIGDHGKNRALLAAAAEWFFDETGLDRADALHLPDTADARAGMHFAFASLERATAQAAEPGAFWATWLSGILFPAVPEPPCVVGVSMMGPSQVFLGIVVARLVKRHWPGSVTVLGGSHATLLAAEMAADARYTRFFDHVLPGHAEEEFAELVRRVRGGRPAAPRVAGVPPAGRPFDYLPLMSQDQLAPYDPSTLTMPLQFTRGCSYGRCTYCTYPVVEPATTRLDAPRAAEAIGALVDRHGVRRFSVKDSLFTVPMMLDLAGALEEAGVRVRWSATTKITPSLAVHAPRLAAAGLSTLEFGVESVHPAGQRLFAKVTDTKVVEDVVAACAGSGIAVVINLIFGLPDEPLDAAERQLAWFEAQCGRAPGMVDGSLNMLEIVRGSPLAVRPPPGVRLRGIAPWAFAYDWNAPSWRRGFADRLRRRELGPAGLTAPTEPL
ncbi:B12-binding domain-containing radical SAM protein [Actinomadura fibrosa]|uniref:B12-binding domain-containing radical SAM protein n=1 Tax=Actinomadura fibrosa TaxID=111802 RepID=A0ABW2X9Y7_9ACTN|nr:radical SAM protein [Actinomadura fibrosa]